MIIGQIIGVDPLNEVNIADKIMKDPNRAKMLSIAWKHDQTLPPAELSKLGPKPDEKAVAEEWSRMLEQKLSHTNFGDISRDFKFADWLTKLYVNGAADWEDISGEGGDALGAWHALSTRGLLDKQHQDLNSYKTLKKLQASVVNNQKYQAELKRIRNAAEIAKMKKDARELTIIDDDRYWVSVPFNYGACYVFNTTGHISTFCTGGSSGRDLFRSYSVQGMLVMIIDKQNVNNEDGKWQMQASSGQFYNSTQRNRYDRGERFGEMFPGLMRRIIAALQQKASAIHDMSLQLIGPPGYNIPHEIAQIKEKFPKSLTKDKNQQDEPSEEEPIPAQDAVPEAFANIAEQYRQYLSPNLINNINPLVNIPRRLRATKGDGSNITSTARNVNDLFADILRDRPEWLLPGSVVRLNRVRRTAQ